MPKKPPTGTKSSASLAQVEIRSRSDLRKWLKKNHRQAESIWLVIFKKSTPQFYVGYDAIVEEALCFGWIDSLPRKLDDRRSMLRLSPRKAKSSWSKINRDRVTELIDKGLMTPAGLRVIQEAQRSGAWQRLEETDDNQVPPDLLSKLNQRPKAKAFFDSFPPSTRRAILEWISSARTPETRHRRISETVRLAARNLRANQYRQTK